jgi:hypothetical protein
MKHNDNNSFRHKIVYIKSLILMGLLLMVACQPVLKFQVVVETPMSQHILGKVAYIQGGDIWIVDLDVIKTIRLTQDGYNSHPVWSSDGTKIAFLKKGQLWIIDLNTNQTDQVSEISDEWFIWSVSGNDVIYFSRSKGLMSWNLVSKTDTTIIPISTGSSINNITWDKRGETIVFNKGLVESGRYLVSLEKINIQQNDTGTISSTNNMIELPIPAEESPGGEWVAYWQWNTEITFPEKVGLPICIVSTSGGNAYCIASKAVPSTEFVDWSFDDKLVLFTIENKLAIVDSSIPSEQILIDLPNQSPIYPSWSSDAKNIAFSAMSASPKNTSDVKNQNESCINRRIWSIEVDTIKLQQLTDDDDFCDELPLWSADGKYILFARLNKDSASLWLMHSDGDLLNQVVQELTPMPEPFGEYGYIDWPAWYDWWRPNSP